MSRVGEQQGCFAGCWTMAHCTSEVPSTHHARRRRGGGLASSAAGLISSQPSRDSRVASDVNSSVCTPPEASMQVSAK